MARRFDDEADPDVWTVLLAPLRLFDKVVGVAGSEVLATFVRRLTLPRFTQLTWQKAKDEPERAAQLRAQLVSALGTLGADDAVVAHCRVLHEHYLSDRASVDPDLIDAVVGVVAENGDERDYETFLARYREPSTPQEEMRYLYALGRFPDPALIQRTLALTMSEVRTQNAPYLIAQLLGSRRAGPAAWEFVAAQWDEMCERFPGNAIPRMIEGLAAQADATLATTARAFFAEHEVPLGELQVRQTLERLDVNVAFATREAERLLDALR